MSWKLRSWRSGPSRIIICLAMLLSVATNAIGAEASARAISIELNRAQEQGAACRLSFVFTNGVGQPVAKLAIETVLFNKKGQVERFVVLRSRPLPKNKIRAQQFDVKGLKCGDLGRLLLNDVKACTIPGVELADCLGLMRVSSRAGVPFISTTTEQ